ncbi:hypothetical protein [Synechococcus sp. MIT S1220]|uniref:hypothetical protein n=1 Tax=Synechococcus sp. MIT S1220 TaxID=3082549 RepID=UPI0039B11D70
MATGYLTIFGVRQIPYEFDNEWLVVVPALVLVYALTVWLDGKLFKDDAPQVLQDNQKSERKISEIKKGFRS